MSPSLLRSPALYTVVTLLALAAAGMTAGAHYFQLYFEKKEIYPRSGLLVSSVPRETPTWAAVGADRREEADVEAVLGTKNYVSRLYELKDPPKDRTVFIDLHIAYYTGTIGPVPHVPDRCFVGGGMQIGEVLGNLPLPLRTDGWHEVEDCPDYLRGRLVKVRSPTSGNYATLPRDAGGLRLRTMQFLNPKGPSTYAGYFFVANGGWVCQAEQVRLLAFDLRTPYAYYMKVQFTSSSVRSGEELARYAASMLDELFPDIMACAPDWVEVETGKYP